MQIGVNPKPTTTHADPVELIWWQAFLQFQAHTDKAYMHVVTNICLFFFFSTSNKQHPHPLLKSLWKARDRCESLMGFSSIEIVISPINTCRHTGACMYTTAIPCLSLAMIYDGKSLSRPPQWNICVCSSLKDEAAKSFFFFLWTLYTLSVRDYWCLPVSLRVVFLISQNQNKL